MSFTMPATDLDILQFSLAYEYLEFAQYQMTLMSGVLSGNDLALVMQFSRNEAGHISALQQTIRQLGSNPVQARQAYNLPRFGNRDEALRLLGLFCDTGASAYLGAAPLIKSNDLLITGVRFHNVETLQASVLRDMSGLAPSPYMVAKGRTAAEIVAIITPYLAAPGSVAAPPPPQPIALVQGNAVPATAPAAAPAVAPAPAPAPTAAPAPAPAATTSAETVFAVTPNNLLLRFSSASAQVIDRAVTITGLQAGETLLGMDFRPANKQLYAVGGTSRIYTINTDTGAATAVGAQFTPRIVGRVYGFDFNPMADAIRLISSEDQNLRISPTTGQVVGTDTNAAYATGDTNAGKNIIVTGAAYTNNVAGATSTQLYVIDAANDVLGRIDTPNNGQVRTVGALGGGAGGYVGFDIANGVGYVSFSTATSSSGLAVNSPFEPAFGTIDLTTGKFTPVSPIGVAINTLEIVGIAVQPR